MNFIEKLRRLALVVENLPHLPRIALPLDTGAPWSELRKVNYESPHYFHRAVWSALFPIYAPFREVPYLPYEVPEENKKAIEDDQAWYFLNGICTDRNVLRLNGRALANVFRRRIYLMHNPSDGIALDLLECAIGRTMQFVSTLDSSVAQILEDALERHSKVVLLVHSQGGIIATGALYQLHRRLAGTRALLLDKLEVYTFASAATEMEIPGLYAEHFYHTDDYIARIGVAGNPGRFPGRHFRYQASGHLFNTHYLANFCKGRFRSQEGGTSKLDSYLPDLKPVSTTRRRKARLAAVHPA